MQELRVEYQSLRIDVIEAIILLTVMVFLFFIVIARIEKISDLSVSFDQDINGLRPFIGEEKFIEFRSKWAMMKTKEDWKDINLQIEEIKRINNLKFN